MNHQDLALNSLLQLDAWQVPDDQFCQAFAEQFQIESDFDLEPSFDIPQINPYAPLHF